MDFYDLPTETQDAQIRRIMEESARQFSHKEVARRYIEMYEEMLERPLVEKESGESIKAIAESRGAKPGA